MKKVYAFLLSLCIVLALAACGGQGGASAPADSGSGDAAQAPADDGQENPIATMDSAKVYEVNKNLYS